MNNEMKPIQEIISEYEQSLIKIILYCLTELPFPLGIKKTIAVLKGTKSTFIIDNNMNKLISFSLLSPFSSNHLRRIIEILIQFEMIKIENVPEHEYMPILILSESGKDYLEGRLTTQISILDSIIDKEIPEFTEFEKSLFQQLREKRHVLSEQKDLPAYMICSDQVLREICFHKPANRDEMLNIKGIGDKFFNNYGNLFLNIVNQPQN
jgi:ATP-dependent DNA helicase RecQ